MAFKVGDKVVLDNLNQQNQEAYRALEVTTSGRWFKNQTILSVIAVDQYIRVTDGREARNFYPWRLKRVAAKKIAVGDKVVCTDFGRSIYLELDAVYEVIDIKRVEGERHYRVKGDNGALRAWYKASQFRPSGLVAAAEQPKQEPKKPPEDPAKQYFDKIVGKGTGSLCTFGIFYEDGTEAIHLSAICHAPLNQHNYKKVKAVALNLNRHVKKGDEENYKRFLNFVVNESSIKDCFIPRKAEQMIKDGVLLNVEKTASELAIAAITLRQYSEFGNFSSLFNKVMDLGFDGEVAMVVGQYFVQKEDGSLVFSKNQNGHSIFQSRMDADQLFKFVKQGIDKGLLPKNSMPYKEGGQRYRVWESIAMDSDNNSITEFVKKLKGMVLAGDGWGAKLPTFKGNTALVRVCAQFAKVL